MIWETIMKILIFLLSVVLIYASPFQWEDEIPQKPKLDTHKKPLHPVQPNPAIPPHLPSKPSPATPGGIPQNPGNNQFNPFDDPFFSGSMSIHDMHQQMRQRQEALLKQFGNFFDDPFFRSPMGLGMPPRVFPGQGGINQPPNNAVQPNQSKSPKSPWNQFSKSWPRKANGDLQVLNKKDFIVVQKVINPRNNMDYQVKLQGRTVTVTSQSKQQNEETSQYGRSFSQSYSSSTQSVMLPEDVLNDFTQRVVGDKLVLVFQKK